MSAPSQDKVTINWFRILAVTGERAAATAFREKVAGNAGWRDVLAVTQRKRERMLPDGVPGGAKEIAKSFVVRLAGDNLPIGFDAHIV